MASVTGMTAEAIDTALDEMIVGISVDPTTGELFAHPRSGDPISAGPAIAPLLAVDAAWPVGSIYMSVASGGTNPYTILGVGTWVRFGKGKTIVSLDEAQTEFDGLEETGGEKTHALSSGELAAHTHSTPDHRHDIIASYNLTPTASGSGSNRMSGWSWAETGEVLRDNGSTEDGGAGTTGSSGSGTAHNNLQPYIVAYIWKRTA